MCPHPRLARTLSPLLMHPELTRVFAYFEEFGPIAIMGSAVWTYDTALDIDVLFLRSANFPQICRELGVKYCGWDRNHEHLRVTRESLLVPGVSKPVHLSWSNCVHMFTDHPFSVLLPDGAETKPGVYLTVRKGERNGSHSYLPGEIGTSTSSPHLPSIPTSPAENFEPPTRTSCVEKTSCFEKTRGVRRPRLCTGWVESTLSRRV